MDMMKKLLIFAQTHINNLMEGAQEKAGEYEGEVEIKHWGPYNS